MKSGLRSDSSAATELAGVLQNLYKLRTFGIKPGLERIEALLESMGNPQRELAVVHVAGTNGKGSVCAMIESILRASGHHTGLYTSPHLVRFNERFKVGGGSVDDEKLLSLIKYIEPHADEVSSKHGDVTFFEFSTAIAFEHFKREGGRVCVVETGMGGRLDATNVVLPLLSVITRISMEHSMYLGDDLETIAGEKAGIIKPGRPVLCGETDDVSRDVMKTRAREMGCRFVVASDRVSVQLISHDLTGQRIKIASTDEVYPRVTLPLLGRHQLENCATAVAAVEEFSTVAGMELDRSAVVEGLSNVEWMGRCQVLSEDPPIILDGAHNPAAGEVLAQTLKGMAGKKPVGLVVGMCSDKDASGFLKPFSTLVKRCWAVPIQDARGMPAGELASLASGYGWEASAAELPEALGEAGKWAREKDGLICIAGSLYLVGEVLQEIG